MSLETLWYGRSPWRWLLWPLSQLYRGVVVARRAHWLAHPERRHRSRSPLVVVGNLTVGGSGKTPLVVALVQYAQAAGLRPAVVSRGYGGRAPNYPCLVASSPEAARVGDEPLLIWQRTGCPVMVDPQRARAVALLERDFAPDVIISDDGLQHYAMARDLELVVVDRQRGFGNGLCLPAGPLREPLTRLRDGCLMVGNGGSIATSLIDALTPGAGARTCFYHLVPTRFVTLDGTRSEDVASWSGVAVRAVAGIGHPRRFFDTLEALGVSVDGQAFPDHHRFAASDFDTQEQRPLVMTEKDAVKCRHLGLQNAWYLEVEARLSPDLRQAFQDILNCRR